MYPWRPEEGIRSLEAGVTACCKACCKPIVSCQMWVLGLELQALQLSSKHSYPLTLSLAHFLLCAEQRSNVQVHYNLLTHAQLKEKCPVSSWKMAISCYEHGLPLCECKFHFSCIYT